MYWALLSVGGWGKAEVCCQPVSQQRMSGVLGAPPPAKREIGDCYVWGGWGDAEVGDKL
jgi:hypothetical protein